MCVVTAVKAHHTGGAQVPIIHKDDPRLSFGSCMQEITRGVAPGTPRQDVDAALALLEEDAQLLQQLQQRPGSCHWAVVKCGVWRDDAEAPKGWILMSGYCSSNHCPVLEPLSKRVPSKL